MDRTNIFDLCLSSAGLAALIAILLALITFKWTSKKSIIHNIHLEIKIYFPLSYLIIQKGKFWSYSQHTFI